MPILWRLPTATSGHSPAGADPIPLHRRAASWLLAIPILLLAGQVQAAPQILGIVASNGLPTPLHCADGYCSAYLASFCLQEARYAPNSGSEYRLAPGGSMTILASTPGGAVLRLPGEGLVAVRSDRKSVV